jgi:glc operon protein GlcG
VRNKLARHSHSIAEPNRYRRKTNEKLPVVSILTAALIASTVNAHIADRKTLTLDGARRVIAAAVAEAHKNNEGGVVVGVDDGGNLMALERIDGSFAAGANISIAKARTAAQFNKPRKFFEDVIGKARIAVVVLSDFTPLQGGVPIIAEGQMVGAVGVSGAANAQQDEHLAMTGAAVINAMRTAVTYFKSDDVTSAFAKGAVLFNGGDKYMLPSGRSRAGGFSAEF